MNLYIDNAYFLADEDINLLNLSVKKWKAILYSHYSINLSKSSAIIKKAYNFLELPIPNIVFKRGFIPAKNWIKKNYCRQIEYEDYHRLYGKLHDAIFEAKASKEVPQNLAYFYKIICKEDTIFRNIYSVADNLLNDVRDYYTIKAISGELECINNAYNQYCIEVLKWEHNSESWDILKKLALECPFIIPLTEVCLVIDRPIEVNLNDDLLPHAKNKPAIKFADGFAIYCHHGIPFPAEYGRVPIERWKPKWILSEETAEYRSVLMYEIGCKRFRRNYPKYDFWQERYRLVSESIEIIIYWQLYHYNRLYLKNQPTDSLQVDPYDALVIKTHLPFKLPTELYNLYHFFNGGYQLAPDLYFYPVKKAIESFPKLTWLKSYNGGKPFPLFKGSQGEIYYVLANKLEATYSHVYCQFPDKEPMIYAECVTSLIVTIAQCYQEGGYYIVINEETREREIEQDLDKIEPIFEKFNPDQINSWRKIWRN